MTHLPRLRIGVYKHKPSSYWNVKDSPTGIEYLRQAPNYGKVIPAQFRNFRYVYKIDHFMYATSDLDAGIEWAQDNFDATPKYGGEHIGLGTRNALLSLGETYLEIIAPDPAQPLTGTFGERIAQLSKPGLVTWAVSGDLQDATKLLSAENIKSRGPMNTKRSTSEGSILSWDLLFPSGAGLDGCTPFFIDWLACPHPSTTNPVGGKLTSMSLQLPQQQALPALCQTMHLPVTITTGLSEIEVVIQCDNHEVILTSTAESLTLDMF